MTDNVRWVVETGLDVDAENRLLGSLNGMNGIEVVVRKNIPLGQGLNPGAAGSGGDLPIVFHGSLQGAKWVQENTDWEPGAIANNDAFRCRSYYPIFGKHLLNRRHLFMPFGCLEERRDDLFKWLGEDDCIFVRPDNNDKPFAGQLVRREKWDEDMALVGFYDSVTPDLMVVVAEPQNITHEYRFFVHDGEVLTGSMYRESAYTMGTREARDVEEPWAMARIFAQRAKGLGYNPDPIWSLDVCKDAENQTRILEVGSFSCAGIYECDTDILAKAATKIARESQCR